MADPNENIHPPDAEAEKRMRGKIDEDVADFKNIADNLIKNQKDQQEAFNDPYSD